MRGVKFLVGTQAADGSWLVRSRAVIRQMCDDERRHGESGRALGAAELPFPVKLAMRTASKVMTRTAYWV